MLKFFRKIRRKLIEEGNLKRYLVYAIGEVLLVMIGILLALQVNNWNEDSKNRKSEKIALLELKDEFDRSLTDIERIFEIKQKAEYNLREYAQILFDNDKTKAQKAKVDRPFEGAVTWDPSMSVLKGLLSSGNNNALESNSLRQLLNGWDQKVINYKEMEQRFIGNISPKLLEYEESKVPFMMPMKGDYVTINPNFIGYSKNKVQKLRENIVDDILYHNLISQCITHLYVQLTFLTQIKKDLSQIRELLEEEISNR